MYSRILVPLDGSPASQRGLDEAIRLAGTTRGRLVLLNVSQSLPDATDLASASAYRRFTDSRSSTCAELVGAAGQRASQAGLEFEQVVADAEGRSVARAILDAARERACDAIVMGTHGRRGLSRVVMGSDAEEVLRGSSTPVLLVRLADAA